MRLNVDFSDLHKAVRRMGADSVNVQDIVGRNARALDRIDIELGDTGIVVDLNDLDFDNNLLSYEGRQVLLYIQDHGSSVGNVIEEPRKGRKYHVAFCRTLEKMRTEGRFERYVATNDLGGEFYITGYDWVTKRSREGKAALKVCKNCLIRLNYKGFRQSRGPVFNGFRLDEFFSTYSSFFDHMPSRWAGDYDGGYVDDWPAIATGFKQKTKFRCESCNVSLAARPDLLHAHHRDGVKTNNRSTNLQVLCADCHRKKHAHMHVPHEDMQAISRLRRSDGIGVRPKWKEAFELSDPAVHGVLFHMKNLSYQPPEIGYEFLDRRGKVVGELELAWPGLRLAVVVTPETGAEARKLRWQVLSVAEALERTE